MSEQQPWRRTWRKVKDGAPRQRTIAGVVRQVRSAKPQDSATARTLLIAEARKQGLTDLSDKEVRLMIEAVTTSAKDASTQAVAKGTAQVKALWANLQSSTPQWVQLPDRVSALNLRSDQQKTDVAIQVDAPDVLQRLHTDLRAEPDGTRDFDAWLCTDPATRAVRVKVGAFDLGYVPAGDAAIVAQILGSRTRIWTSAKLRYPTPDSAIVTLALPDRR